MGNHSLLANAVSLLERIENSDTLKNWCEHYSVYGTSQKMPALENEIFAFTQQVYQAGLLIVDYYRIIEKWELRQQDLACADPDWSSRQPYICILAAITWHFRRDHFANGTLISSSIASGALLRLFRRLDALCPWSSVAVTLKSLYCQNCECIPDAPGVYHILVPQGMSIHFSQQQYNRFAPLYSVQKLTDKYAQCIDKDILYIGKAEGHAGLRQRLRQYMKYGWDNGTNHRGGRAIWQIEDAGLLLVVYETCDNPSAKERQLIDAYKRRNGCFPLANWRR